MTYSRDNPSKRYRFLVDQYIRMHQKGYSLSDGRVIEGSAAFPGYSLIPFAQQIKQMVEDTGTRTILDYGCGKGRQYDVVPDQNKTGTFTLRDFWGVEEITLWDPAFHPDLAKLEKIYDGVVCTDVLEHCPSEDIDWIIEEIFSLAAKMVFFNVACFDAMAILPDGNNAHVTVRSPEWWSRVIRRIGDKYSVQYRISCSVVEPTEEV